MIIYLHNYSSPACMRASCDAMKKWFFYLDIMCLEYDYLHPEKAHIQIDRAIHQFGVDKIKGFIGLGLGGFWARYFANRYDKHLLMINPSLDPDESHKCYGTFTEENLLAFKKFKIKEDKQSIPITVLLGMSDTFIDPYKTYDKYKERAEVHRFVNEGHIINVDTLRQYISQAA